MKRVAVFLAMSASAVVVAPPAHAAGVRAGAVEIVDATDSSAPLSSGGSATTFTMKLPDNSTCPGDSADDNYRVQSFLVPASVDPAGIRYKSQGPDVPGGWAVYKTTSNAFIQEMTADAKNPGDPGPIVDLPALSFAVFTGGELAAGRYHVGVACSLFNDTVKFWATDITLRPDASDKPAGLAWTVANGAASDESAGAGLPVAIGVAGGAALVAGIAAVRKRSRGAS